MRRSLTYLAPREEVRGGRQGDFFGYTYDPEKTTTNTPTTRRRLRRLHLQLGEDYSRYCYDDQWSADNGLSDRNFEPNSPMEMKGDIE